MRDLRACDFHKTSNWLRIRVIHVWIKRDPPVFRHSSFTWRPIYIGDVLPLKCMAIPLNSGPIPIRLRCGCLLFVQVAFAPPLPPTTYGLLVFRVFDLVVAGGAASSVPPISSIVSFSNSSYFINWKPNKSRDRTFVEHFSQPRIKLVAEQAQWV